jgi:F-type H+-transporting ATPase subunit b
MKLKLTSDASGLSGKRTLLIAGTLCLVLLSTGLCFASGGNDEITWKTTDWYKVMNFAVLAIGLFILVRKPIANALDGRIESIKEDLRALEAEKVEAEKQLEEYNKRIATLDKEVENIVSEYRRQGEAAKSKILASAKEAAEKIEEQAKRNIENEFEVARQKLRMDIFAQAVTRAETLVKGEITSEDQDRLVEEYLNKVVS